MELDEKKVEGLLEILSKHIVEIESSDEFKGIGVHIILIPKKKDALTSMYYS